MSLEIDQKLCDQKWANFEKIWQDRFGKIPAIEEILFLIGLQEIKDTRESYSKEEKEEIMHVGFCHLLTQNRLLTLNYYDSEGWPHYKEEEKIQKHTSTKEQEITIKEYILQYFQE